MINLFNINNYAVDMSLFNNILHGEIVCELEETFASYVGAKYSCFADSASSLLFLSLLDKNATIKIPSTIPPVVPNVIVNTNNKIQFYDNIEWVGHQYHLHDNIYDSAQEVTRDQYKKLNDLNALVVFSFYPTKPVGGCDGGMVASDNKETIDWYRMMVLNGMSYSNNNWERKQIAAGYKMHGNSIQAYIANENLKKLDDKNEKLDEVRDLYNKQLGYENTSRHLYRIRVKDNAVFIQTMKKEGIVCGIHYEHCHEKSFYGDLRNLVVSKKESKQTVSIPYHEKLTKHQINKVVNYVNKFKNN